MFVQNCGPKSEAPSMCTTGLYLKLSLNTRTTAVISQLCFGFTYTLVGDPYLMRTVLAANELLSAYVAAPGHLSFTSLFLHKGMIPHGHQIAHYGSTTCGSFLEINASALSRFLLQ